MEIRSIRPDEWAEYKSLRLQALREAPSAFGSSLEVESELPDDSWRAIVDDDRQRVFGAIDEGVWLGVAGAYEEDAPTVVGVWGMWVHPDHRGRGIGRKLLVVIVDYARNREADRVRLRVTETNLAAKRLYERAGFQLTGARRPLASNPSLDELQMELLLA